jgi:hypothetical protein
MQNLINYIVNIDKRKEKKILLIVGIIYELSL